MNTLVDALTNGWAWSLAYAVLLVLIVAWFGASVERVLIAPDPEEVERPVSPWKAGPLVNRPTENGGDPCQSYIA